MKHKFFVTCFIFLLNIVYSQTEVTQQKGISSSELEKAKTMYLDMMDTKTFIDRDLYTNLYASKLPKPVKMEHLVEDSIFKKHISENLQKSKFKSIGEAMELRKKCADLEEQLAIENPEFYRLLRASTVQQAQEILEPTFAKNRH